MRKFILIIFILFQLNSFSQTKTEKYDFDLKIMEVSGDLNKDNLFDKVIVNQDKSENGHYRLQVFFKEPNGHYKLIVTSTTFIGPKYPNGICLSEIGFSEVKIKNGILSINFQLVCGHSEYKFRYQNENFELIGFSKVYSDGLGLTKTTDYNLTSGTRIEKFERYDKDQFLSNTKKKILIRPLPKLQDIIPMENVLY